MIKIDREKGYIILSRCEYLYRDGLDSRDDTANREMGDGDIVIPLPHELISRERDGSAEKSAGQSAEIIIAEIRKRLGQESEAMKDNDEMARLASMIGDAFGLPLSSYWNQNLKNDGLPEIYDAGDIRKMASALIIEWRKEMLRDPQQNSKISHELEVPNST